MNLETKLVAATDQKEKAAAELSGFITYRMSRVSPKLNAQAGHILRKHAGLSLVQWRIIALVHSFGPNISSKELADLVGMDKGLFSRSLKTLLSAGLVAGENDANDLRRTLLTTTQDGNAIYERTIKVMRRRQAFLLHDLSEEEIAVLMHAMDILEKNAERRDF